MATVKQFEDLICWQRARELTKGIYRICRNFEMAKDRGLCDQIQRASVSVMSNIAEGFERGTKTELINYFYIAKGSCAEVRCQLHVALDARYIDMTTFRNLYSLADETGRLTESFIQKVKIGSEAGLQHKSFPKPRQMPSYIKETLGEHPEYLPYYDAKSQVIQFWKMPKEMKDKKV